MLLFSLVPRPFLFFSLCIIRENTAHILETRLAIIILTDLSEPLCSVHARAMDEDWMKEHSIPRLHLQVHSGMTGVVVPDAVVHLINTTLWGSKQY